jgi:hypothetical protein
MAPSSELAASFQVAVGLELATDLE